MKSLILALGFLCMAHLSHSLSDKEKEPSPWLEPAVIKGYKFFDPASDESLLIKGIDYYPRPNFGPLNDNNVDFYTRKHRKIWKRDIEQFKALGVNAVRLYSVDPNEDHSEFMCALNAAGIYAVVGLASSCIGCAINNEKAPGCYPVQLKLRGEDIIREFAKYSNTLAFSAGNEVNHFVPLGERPQWNAPCLKKFVRDMRAFIFGCEHIRSVPVGVVNADSDRDVNALYYNCLTNPQDWLEAVEWYGINTYVFCDGKVHDYSGALGFQYLADSFRKYKYSVPVLLTEFGCISPSFPTVDGYTGQRSFLQAEFLGSEPDIREQLSGGFIFEYSIEKSIARTPFPFKEFGFQNYVVGYFEPEFCDDVKVPCNYVQLPGFQNLKDGYKNATDQYVAENYTTFWVEDDRRPRSQCPPEFPAITEFEWYADKTLSRSCPSEHRMNFTCDHNFFTNPFVLIVLFCLAAFCLVEIYKVMKSSDKEYTPLAEAKPNSSYNSA